VARCALGVATLPAFSNPETFHGARLSVMVGSIFSAIGGGAVLWSAHRQRLNVVPKEVEPFPG